MKAYPVESWINACLYKMLCIPDMQKELQQGRIGESLLGIIYVKMLTTWWGALMFNSSLW
jgi:hypothetical protein